MGEELRVNLHSANGGQLPQLRHLCCPVVNETLSVSSCGFCRALRDVWQQLQDVNNSYGLRYQWGGSHTNKVLLCSLGIDTRNIVSLVMGFGQEAVFFLFNFPSLLLFLLSCSRVIKSSL